MKQVVVCLGNELVGDDGVGIRIGRVLERLPLPPSVDVMIRPNLGLELIELLDEYERVVIVDALTSGRAPGTCVRLDPSETVRMASCPSCSHSLGIPEILQLVERMHPEQADRAVVIVGVEAASIDQFEVGLSESVCLALPDAVATVVDALDLLGSLGTEARIAAKTEALRTVTLADVLGHGPAQPAPGSR